MRMEYRHSEQDDMLTKGNGQSRCKIDSKETNIALKEGIKKGTKDKHGEEVSVQKYNMKAHATHVQDANNGQSHSFCGEHDMYEKIIKNNIIGSEKKDDQLEEYLNAIFEKECRFSVEECELKFIQTGVETYVVRKYIRDYFQPFKKGNCTLDRCDIKHYSTPELLKVGSFYEGTRNKFPDEFDYIVVVGTVDNMPATTFSQHHTCRCLADPSFKYESDLDPLASLEYVSWGPHGPAMTVTFCYKKNCKERLISVDITGAVRYVYTQDIHRIQNVFKESDVFCAEFHNEVLETGSFLLLNTGFYMSAGRETIGPFCTCITETEVYFMKNVLSEKHRRVYRLLKYLLNGKFSDKLLKETETFQSFGICSYDIKSALISHHYRCKDFTTSVSDCILDILNYFLYKTCYNQRMKKTEIISEIGYEVLADTLYDFDLNRTLPSIYGDLDIFISTSNVFRGKRIITGTENFINTIITTFYNFTERLVCLRNSNYFKNCSHDLNDCFLEMVLQVPWVLESVAKKMSKEDKKRRNESDWTRLCEITSAIKVHDCPWCNYSSGKPLRICSRTNLSVDIYTRIPRYL